MLGTAAVTSSTSMTLATAGRMQSRSLVEPIIPPPSPALPERVIHVQKMLAAFLAGRSSWKRTGRLGLTKSNGRRRNGSRLGAATRRDEDWLASELSNGYGGVLGEKGSFPKIENLSLVYLM